MTQSMPDNIKVIDNTNYVNAKDVYESIKEKRREFEQENMTRYNDWISRLIVKFPFQEGVDFYSIMSKSTGGRPAKDYYVSFSMAQELCLLDNSKIGQIVRKKYINLYESVKRKEIIRLVGIEARKSMTDTIQEKGINELHHGHAYSNFTKLVYKKLGIEYIKDKNFRDKLSTQQLKAIEILENIVKSYLELGYDYSKIKETLPEILTLKDNKELL
jgi:phage anti-repressor protein